MDEHDAEIEVDIAENVPLLKNTYKIFKKYFEPSLERKPWAKYYMSEEEASCHRKETSCHRKKLTVTRISIQSREKTSCDWKKPPVTKRSLLSQ
jgi:hypothetical protein